MGSAIMPRLAVDIKPAILDRAGVRRTVAERFTVDQDIRARENRLRQHAISTTRQALKEHFVLDKIATLEAIEVTPSDIDFEIRLMALQRGESPRRVRLNGEDIGTAWSVPFIVQLGARVRPGSNVLELELTNLAANRIRDMDRRGVPSRSPKR